MVPQKMKIQTGDIIITETDYPMIEHFGVVVIEDSLICVFHCTPTKNVTIDTFAGFLENRTFKKIRKTTAKKNDIYRRYQQAKHKKYDLLKFNCIHFAEFLTGKNISG